MFEIAQVYFSLAGYRVYEGHLQNERAIKTFRKHPKSTNFLSALSPVFISCIIYALFVEIPSYIEIPLIDFCETLHNRRQAPKVMVVYSISKEKADRGWNSNLGLKLL